MAKKKILIVDDSVDTRLVVSARLKKHGYDTVFAADGMQAHVCGERTAGCDLA